MDKVDKGIVYLRLEILTMISHAYIMSLRVLVVLSFARYLKKLRLSRHNQNKRSIFVP